MEILPNEACLGFLKRNHVGVIALANGDIAYAIPLFYAFDGKRLYFQSHPGEKDRFLEHSKEGCFVVSEVKDDMDWRSVQAMGKVEKITLTDDLANAFDALSKNPFPPEFGADWKGDPKVSADRMYLWMMTPRKISGRVSRKREAPATA